MEKTGRNENIMMNFDGKDQIAKLEFILEGTNCSAAGRGRNHLDP